MTECIFILEKIMKHGKTVQMIIFLKQYKFFSSKMLVQVTYASAINIMSPS